MTDLLAAMEESWPAAGVRQVGPFRLRLAPGGGNRVACATATGPVAPGDLGTLEAAARGEGQAPCVMLRAGEDGLDALLAAEGWRMGEDCVVHAGPLPQGEVPPLAAFALWPPLAVQRDLWAAEGTGPGKLAVMARGTGPRAAILGRVGDRPAGTAFVAVAQGVAFLHALVVEPEWRRRGLARQMLLAAADWARGEGAGRMALAVTRGNAPARALYAFMGLQPVGQYHYRVR